ncbi:MAG: hypothetical protein R3E57_05985 [Porticoccaceae bacterium]
MQNWFVIDLGDALLAGPDFDDLEIQLTEIYEQTGKPAGMAAYYRHETTAGLYCSVVVYLNPSFAPYAGQLGAISCQPPEQHSLSPLLPPLE